MLLGILSTCYQVKAHLEHVKAQLEQVRIFNAISFFKKF